jgi:hypothetical protein
MMQTGENIEYFVNRGVILAQMETDSIDTFMISAREMGEDRKAEGRRMKDEG